MTLVVVGLTNTQSVQQSSVLNHICELYMKSAQYAQYACLGSNMQNMQNTHNILLCCFILNLLYLLLLEDAVILLLSRGMGGKPKEANDVSWYFYRKRAILSGSTDITAYILWRKCHPRHPCRGMSPSSSDSS